MRTDITLRRGPRTLIIEAKDHRSTMQTGQYGTVSIHSANLYQILAYTKNADVRRDGSTSGMLLYARTAAGRQPDLDVVSEGDFPAALHIIAIAGVRSVPAPRPTALCSSSAVRHLPSSASPSYAI